jgi:hypothetical protein
MAKTTVMPKPSAIWRATFAISIAGPSLQVVLECACDRRSWRELELAVLVVERLSGLVGDFRDGYYRAWKDVPEDCS